MSYVKSGKITHFFDRILVAVLLVTDEVIKVGDTIKIGEEEGGFEQTVESMQVNHEQVNEAAVGSEVGLKLVQKCSSGDFVYKKVD